jgi:RNA polymerase sigma-70 factor, ECF subfamily
LSGCCNAREGTGKIEMMTKPDDRREPIRAAEQLEELFRSHYPAVVSYVRRRAPAATVDDIVADTFMVAWRRLERVPADSLPWLLAVAGNVIATQRRATVRHHALLLRLRSAAVETVESVRVEEVGPVRLALLGLSEKDREALTLIAWDGLRPAQAATVLGESPGTFRVRLHRARRRLRRLLAEQSESATHRPLEANEIIKETP